MVERPIRTALSTRCAGITRGHAMRHRSAGGTAHRPETGSSEQPTFSNEGCDGRVNPKVLARRRPTNDASVNQSDQHEPPLVSTSENPVRSRGGAGLQPASHSIEGSHGRYVSLVYRCLRSPSAVREGSDGRLPPACMRGWRGRRCRYVLPVVLARTDHQTAYRDQGASRSGS